ncbi:DUF6482 family protein [Halomonas caseinilytica]|uniref:Uncharacterized protein n=1 Tax=Halomonas caseinilytica TaxID=438744 RepID=A0A1M6SR23_9GAMM|nr:DUF6482 family protein [Halomonas caseinilytica]SEM59659.1 hypothetical protein SAMN04487952_10589 [Halomonas caseinilytica]SHK47192.1 hypothetical protein SAMN05192556_10389 [Halomonas caseinilytica]
MDLNDLRAFVAQHDNFEIRVIGHAGNRFYQVELEDVEGQRHMLTSTGKPMLFRSLDDVYLELKRAGVNRAYLVEQVPEDEMIGHRARYRDPLNARMPLVF